MWYQTARCLSFAAIISPPRRGNTLSAGSSAQEEERGRGKDGRMDGREGEREGGEDGGLIRRFLSAAESRHARVLRRSNR